MGINRTSWDALYEELTSALAEINSRNETRIARCRSALELCQHKMVALKASIQNNTFASEEEEIHFFKRVKPEFHSLLIYHAKLYDLELRKPVGRPAVVQQFQKELLKIELFFESHLPFVEYYRSGETDRDHRYFLRSGQTIHPAAYYRHIDEDNRFNTPMDYWVSRLMANDLLVQYLTSAMHQEEEERSAIPIKKEKIAWTAKDISFYELVYLVAANDWVEDGKATVTSIARALGQAFNKRVDNISKKMEEIRMRKKDRVAAITTGIARLHQRIEDDDLKAR